MKQSRLVEAVLQARRRVEDGIRAHRHGAVCRSGSRWRASLDFPLVRICRCRAACCGCTWSACCRCSGSQSARRARSALYADACQQIADAIRVRCNQLSVLCGRLATTGVGDPTMRRALQRSLPKLEMTITSSAWSGSVWRPISGPIRDGVCQASPRGARRGVGLSVPLLVRPLRAFRSLRHIAELSSRGVACSCSRWDVGCATTTRDAGVRQAVVRGSVDALERTVPNRR